VDTISIYWNTAERGDRTLTRYVTFQMAEVAIPRDLFADILNRIDRLRPKPAPASGLFNADTLDGWAPVWGWNKLIPSAAVV